MGGFTGGLGAPIPGVSYNLSPPPSVERTSNTPRNFRFCKQKVLFFKNFACDGLSFYLHYKIVFFY